MNIVFIFIISLIQARENYQKPLQCLREIGQYLPQERTFEFQQGPRLYLWTEREQKDLGVEQGFLQIEGNQAKICGIIWEIEKTRYIKVKDQKGDTKVLIYERYMSPNWSYANVLRTLPVVNMVAAQAHSCDIVTGHLKTRRMIQQMISIGLKNAFLSSSTFKVPKSCVGPKELSEIDLQKIKEEVSKEQNDNSIESLEVTQ